MKETQKSISSLFCQTQFRISQMPLTLPIIPVATSGLPFRQMESRLPSVPIGDTILFRIRDFLSPVNEQGIFIQLTFPVRI
jgi:hypothetical protein